MVMGIEASTIEHKLIDCGSNSHLAAGWSRLKAVQPEKGTEAKEGLQPVIISDEVKNIWMHLKRTRGGLRKVKGRRVSPLSRRGSTWDPEIYRNLSHQRSILWRTTGADKISKCGVQKNKTS